MASNTLTQPDSRAAVTTTLRFPEDLLKRAKRAAIDFNTSLQQLVRDGLELRLRELELTSAVSAGNGDGGSSPRKAKR
jgi:hypothetical protein